MKTLSAVTCGWEYIENINKKHNSPNKTNSLLDMTPSPLHPHSKRPCWSFQALDCAGRGGFRKKMKVLSVFPRQFICLLNIITRFIIIMCLLFSILIIIVICFRSCSKKVVSSSN